MKANSTNTETDDTGKYWKTNISTVNWYDGERPFKKAKLCLGAEEPREVSWLDEIFRGGIKVFEGNHPVTLLVKGPPGSGKTTFALELCYRLAINETEKIPIETTYISVESESRQIIKNAIDFGWEHANHPFVMGELQNDAKRSLLSIWGSEQIVEGDLLTAENIIGTAYESLADICKIKLDQTFIEKIKTTYKVKKILPKDLSHILVIDSLNSISTKKRESHFQNFLKIAKQSEDQNVKLMIFILDGKSDTDINPVWEYLCDTIVELNYHEENNYLIRTIEVIKSRYQGHVWGKHQMKIYSKFTSPNNDESTDNLLRSHPFREEGGIFIFPSIHFYLSKYKKIALNDAPNYDKTYPASFSEFLTIQSQLHGLPKGRCTAFIGCRGGHKSHVGYLHILSKLKDNYAGMPLENREAALIISLRDDEKMTEKTLSHILESEFPNEKRTIGSFIKDGCLEILYYPPGYISPEEFIHRIYVSIHRLKARAPKNVTVLFNSLDQLAARFPLCAKEDIFIPSIIQILIGEAITSIFIAVDDKDQPVRQYGLLPMADLILSFHKYQVSDEDYHAILKSDTFNSKKYKYPDNKQKQDKETHTHIREEIIITVDRFAGGKKAGAKGLLELGNTYLGGGKKLNKINFVQISPDINIDKDLFRKID